MKRLDQLFEGYPLFQPNQLLTSEQLNTVVDYLEQQERLTRQRLIGIGIVCGFRVWTTEHEDGGVAVHISSGAGITSEGFLITLFDEAVCTYLEELSIEEEEYAPLAGIKVAEILQESEVLSGSEARRLKKEDLEDKVVLLYLQILDQEVAKCVVNDCDERGMNRKFRLRKLLIDRDDAANLITYGWEDPCMVRTEIRALPEVELPRPLLKGVSTFEELLEVYKEAIVKAASELEDALSRLYTLCLPLIDDDGSGRASFEGLKHRALEFLEKYPRGAQYIYDYLKDLKKGYEELREALFMLVARCSPEVGLFPRHLLLGIVQPKAEGAEAIYHAEPQEVLRTCFVPSPIHDGQRELAHRIRQLLGRLTLMAQSLSLEELVGEDSPIKVVPSKDCSHPLGEQALPAYYDKKVAEELRELWDFGSHQLGKSGQRVEGYHLVKEDHSHLLKDFCSKPKLRIEGHIGKKVELAVKELNKLKERFNLDFHIVTLKLGRDHNRLYLSEDNPIADLKALYRLFRERMLYSAPEWQSLMEEQKEKLYALITYLIYRKLLSQGGATLNMLEQKYNSMKNIYGQIGSMLSRYMRAVPAELKSFNANTLRLVAHNYGTILQGLRQYIEDWKRAETLLSTGQSSRAPYSLYALRGLVDEAEALLTALWDERNQQNLYTLVDMLTNRVKQVGLFSAFSEAHSGMEHIGGTLWGGTFILVYEDSTPTKRVRLIVKDKQTNRAIAGAAYGVYRVDDGSLGNLLAQGTTNQKGEAEFFIPEVEARLVCNKEGYLSASTTIKPTQGKVTLSMTPTQREGPTISEAGGYVVVEVSSVARVTATSASIAYRSPAFNEYLSSTAGRYSPIELAPSDDFVVVADFYLPCRLKESHLNILDGQDSGGSAYTKNRLASLIDKALRDIKKDKDFTALVLEVEGSFQEIRGLFLN